MSQTTVEQILKTIDQLSEADRLELEQRLAERAEQEWQQETAEARRIARERGLDQAAIDQAIDELRHPR